MKNLLPEVLKNSRKFELSFSKIKEHTKIEIVFNKEIQKLFIYLKKLEIDKQLIKIIENQFNHHGFEKFFLGYNSYKIFQKKQIETHEQFINILCLGELFSIPIIFMDDLLDSHYFRNRKPTPYYYFSKRFPDKGKEYTLFISNIIINYFISELLSRKVNKSLKEDLLKSYIYCINKTYVSPTFEYKFIPQRFEDILDIYKKKSHYFTTYFMSEWGSLMGGGGIEKKELEKILLNLTYLASIKNDLLDFVGKKRGVLEDLMNHSNTFGLYILKKSLGSSKEVKEILKEKNNEMILSILNSNENKKEILKRSIQLRNSIKLLVKKYEGGGTIWFLNYLFYADFLLKDLMDNLKYV